MQPSNIQQTHIDISHARFTSYRNMFSRANDYELYGIYCWNEALSSALYHLISMTEVVMRNRFHSVLSLHLHCHQSIGWQDSNDWYNHINLPQKSVAKIQEVTHTRQRRTGRMILKNPAPSANDVVSRMTFGFWPKLLDVPQPWDQLIPMIVPGHRYPTQSHWSVLRNQDALYCRMDLVNKLRNRIAHFEPIWKQGDLLEERRPRQGSPAPQIIDPAPRTPAQVIARLRLLHNRTAEFLKWLSPHRYNDYLSGYVYSHFDWLCTEEGLTAYKSLQPRIEIPVSRLKREAHGLIRKKTMVSVIRKGAVIGTYYPIIR
ncbi:TPA: Abi family protein [Aeromonas veronii]|nr:Abi family protein [Aeromonas veronii]